MTSIYSQPNVKNQLLIENGFDDIQLDIHGFLYQVKGDALVKRDLTGKEIYRYSNKLLGDIAQLDVSNPLRPLLFYKDQGVIAVIDNTLSQQKQIISLNEIGLYQEKYAKLQEPLLMLLQHLRLRVEPICFQKLSL